MNQRIQELAEQATTYIEPTFDSGEGWIFDKEKFAEAIIRECCTALQPALRDMISRGQGRELILEHFGFNPREITMFMLDRKIKQMEKELAELRLTKQ